MPDPKGTEKEESNVILYRESKKAFLLRYLSRYLKDINEEMSHEDRLSGEREEQAERIKHAKVLERTVWHTEGIARRPVWL